MNPIDKMLIEKHIENMNRNINKSTAKLVLILADKIKILEQEIENLKLEIKIEKLRKDIDNES